MSSDGIIWATAVWRAGQPGVIEITVEGAEDGEDVPVVMTQHEPTMRALVSTPWAGTPGQRWERDETGAWWVSVYRRTGP